MSEYTYQTEIRLLLIVIALLVSSSANAESVAALVKKCSASADKSECRAEIDSGTDKLLINADKQFCPPDLSKLSNAEIMNNWAVILKWLEAHSSGQDAERAIADAWRARYPCVKRQP
jgi:hypothetical protein